MDRQIRILVLEDVPADAELMLAELARGGIACAAQRVETEAEFREALDEFAPDLVLADLTLPSFGGMSALAIAGDKRPDAPFIFVSGTLGEEQAIEALKRGATDYVFKTNLRRLAPAVRRAIDEARERAARAGAEQALRESEERFRRLAQMSSDWYWEQDENFRFTLMSGGVFAKAGVHPDEYLGKTRWEMPILGWTQEERKAHKALLEAHEPFRDLVYARRNARGELRHFRVSGEPIFDSQGRFRGYRGTGSDITPSVEAQQRQAMEHAVARELAESDTAAVAIPRIIRIVCECMGWDCGLLWSLDNDGRVLRITAFWCSADAAVKDFVEHSRQGINETVAIRPGEGLVRRAWAGGAPAWIPDVTQESRFRRSGAALKAGLHGGFAFPVLAGDEVSGVLEFFSRDIRPPDGALLEASRAIGRQIGQFIARKRAEEDLNFMATHDGLTGLPNRILFRELLQDALSRGRRRQRLVGLLFVDLDQFKHVNDSLGHAVGDRLLVAVAQRLVACVRGEDTVARLGGDEFCVLLDDLGESRDAAVVAEKLLLQLSTVFRIEEHELFTSASIGIGCYPQDGADAETLLGNTDVAMYRAKEEGRNAYRFFSRDMNVQAHEMLSLSNGLHLGLERGQFLLHYQPRVSLCTGRITGVEALIRWRHPELGLVPPAKFIPIAERSGAILQIGGWVLRQACAQAKAWQARGFAPLRMAVNLSARQFRLPDLAGRIAAILEETGLAADLLELEITESVAMQDPKRAGPILAELSRLGIRLAIDDFGTGYSSLSYLKHFPIDVIKIDKSFVDGIPGDADDVAIIEAIVALARSLGIGLAAEGVETQEQRHFLQALGCQEYQGYLFSEAKPAEELEPLLRGA